MLAGLIATTVVVADDPSAARPPAAPRCYDTVVVGRLVRQTPTVMPSCTDCFIMAWPYIDVLDVKRVVRGHAPRGPLTVLSVQHTWLRMTQKDDRWWLRLNTAGGYNVISDGPHAPLCAKGEAPAQPFIEPRAGQTLGDLERDGDQQYGHMIPGQIVYPEKTTSIP